MLRSAAEEAGQNLRHAVQGAKAAVRRTPKALFEVAGAARAYPLAVGAAMLALGALVARFTAVRLRRRR